MLRLLVSLMVGGLVAGALAADVGEKKAIAHQVLVVLAGDSGENHLPFVAAVKSCNCQVTCVPVGKAPSSAAELKPYDCVVLWSVPRKHMTERQIQAVETHMRRDGSGLLLIGGKNGLGNGGWGDTVLEEVSPLKFHPRKGGLLASPNPKLTFEPVEPLEVVGISKEFKELGEFPVITGRQLTVSRDHPLIEVGLRCGGAKVHWNHSEEILLASWQYEAGRVVVLATGPEWMEKWPKWEKYQAFVKGMLQKALDRS